MKFNIPKMKEIKEKVNNVKIKIKNKKENNVKVQIRYYGLLFLMILLGVVTVANNIKTYNDITRENYVEYELPKDIEADNNKVEVIEYETAISSISTNISNMNKEEINKNQVKVEKYIWPVEGKIIREYAKDTLVYSKTMDMWLIHMGIDIKAKIGEQVKSIANGKIIAVENDIFYGNIVKIKHSNGYVSIYTNLAEEDLPKINQNVEQGETIGKIGTSAYGESEEESHLHFEITKDEASIDPEEFLNNEE